MRQTVAWTRVRRRWYDLLERSPRLHCAYRRRRHSPIPIVHRGTHLVIEGHQGSGNSFAREALRLSNPKVVIASHGHNAAHVIEGLRLGKPTLVIVRPPVDAIASYASRFEEVDPLRELSRYIRFHARLLPHSRRFVIATFDRVTSCYGRVIQDINERFGTRFVQFPHSDERAVRKVFDVLVSHDRKMRRTDGVAAVPDASRIERSTRHREALASPVHAEQLRRCEQLYAQFAALESSVQGTHQLSD